jgi:hypothetical protein
LNVWVSDFRPCAQAKSMQICGSLLLAAMQHSHYRNFNPLEISMHFKSVFFAMLIASFVVIGSSYASDCVPGPNCDACCYANFHIRMVKCGDDEKCWSRCQDGQLECMQQDCSRNNMKHRSGLPMTPFSIVPSTKTKIPLTAMKPAAPPTRQTNPSGQIEFHIGGFHPGGFGR